MNSTNIKISVVVVMILFCLVGAKNHINQEYNKVVIKQQEKALLVEEVKILEAELSYLSNIDRIEKLSSHYLSLNAVATKVVVLTDKELKNNNITTAERKNNPNWRYKSRSNIMNIKHDVR